MVSTPAIDVRRGYDSVARPALGGPRKEEAARQGKHKLVCVKELPCYQPQQLLLVRVESNIINGLFS